MAYQVATMQAVIGDLRGRGVIVHVVDGCNTRGSINFAPRGLVVHHTGDGPGDYPTLGMILRGRPDLPPPLAQWGLGRSVDVWAIAAGRANHAGSGGWRGLAGNTTVWGIEAESTGKGDWTDAQRRNYPVLAAALARHGGFGPEMVCAHREWTPRKPDPAGIDMAQFRAEVARLLAAPAQSTIEEDDMLLLRSKQKGTVLLVGGGHAVSIHTGDDMAALERAGVKVAEVDQVMIDRFVHGKVF
jgi:hypothetical protein